MSTNKFDGFSLLGVSQSRLLSELDAQIGAATLISSTICSFKLAVTVAKWHDLSIVFDRRVFAMLVYNYQGWPVSQRAHPPLPPVGVKLKPLIRTEFGAVIGDSAARVKALDPKLRGIASSAYTNGFSQLTMTRRVGATGPPTSTYLVSQMAAYAGNC